MNIRKLISWAVLIILGYFIGSNVDLLLSFLLDPLRSNFLLSIITLVSGLVALLIYYKQKNDSKKDAANIIYLEVINAERIMKRAKEDLEKNLQPIEYVLASLAMQTGSWSKYKYLFVKDFSSVQWDAVSDFYNKAQLFDEAVTQNNSYFQKVEEQIRINLQRILADFVKENQVNFSKIQVSKKEETAWKKFTEETENFATKYMNRMLDPLSQFFYKPVKPINEIKLLLNNVDLEMSQSSVGAKLKEMAGIKN